MVAALLHARAGVSCDVVVIKTSGDRLADAPLAQIGGKRVFVKEIEDALLDGAIDLAVHSSKDMPADLPAGLALGAVLPREDARDAVVLPVPSTVEGSAHGVERPAQTEPRALSRPPRNCRWKRSCATSAKRRASAPAACGAPRSWRSCFPGARFSPIRGNLDTRLRKLDAGEFDALVLAAAGLRGWARHSVFPRCFRRPSACPLQDRASSRWKSEATTRRRAHIVERIDDPDAAAALAAERIVVLRLGGGCQMPIGAYATVSKSELSLEGNGHLARRRAYGPRGSVGRCDRARSGGHACGRAPAGARRRRNTRGRRQGARGAVEGLQP